MRSISDSGPAEEEETDDAIVDAIKNGESNRFRTLVDRHKGVLFRMVARQVGDASTAEDLCQEIFIKAFKNLDLFRRDASFRTWLIRIGINTANSYLSSRAHRMKLHTEGTSSLEGQRSQSTPEDSHERKELILQFRSCFAQLGARYREVVALCGFEERPYEETAQILSIPVGTVRSRLNKARLLLKDCLARR